jgi:hypothetical protein
MIIGRVGVATIGVKQHTFRATVFVCVCGCGTIANQKKQSLGAHMATPMSEKVIIGKVGVATIGVEQHTFRTTAFVCVWVWHHCKTKKNNHWLHTWRPQFPKNNNHWEGWGGDDWG